MEQRKHQRYPVNFPGVFSNASLQGEEGIVQDLSLGGCRVGSRIPLTVNAALHLQIRPQQAAPIYVSKAVVRWIRESSFGVQFLELATHETTALTRLISSFSPSSQSTRGTEPSLPA